MSMKALQSIFILLLLSEFAAAIMGCAAQGEEEGMKLEVQPQQVLVGNPVSIRASGLDAGQVASLQVSGQDQFGNTWSSEASFRADAAGTIDTSRDAPVGGAPIKELTRQDFFGPCPLIRL